jgi:hypothetical protein
LTVFEQINQGGVMSQLTVIAKLKAKSGAEENHQQMLVDTAIQIHTKDFVINVTSGRY